MFGCIFLNVLFNGFSQLGVDPFVQDVLKGIVLVLAVRARRVEQPQEGLTIAAGTRSLGKAV